MDYGDVVFHIFEDHKRGFYDLDGLWIDAARKLDSEGMLRCYVSDAQAQKRKEFQKFKTEELRRMQADAIKTRFHVAEPLIIGNRATVKVDREFGKASETEIFELVLERGEWRISP